MLLSVPRMLAIAALVIVLRPMSITPASAQPALAGCWSRPPPQSLVEASHVASNQSNYAARLARARTARPAALLLSDGSLKTAFAAGLLVGWSETGTRPQFDVVTAVGPSALIAVFAFLGDAGDRYIADLFACPSASWATLATKATAMIDASLVSSIASRHRAGRRLLVAVKGNAARRSAYWNIGWIAEHRPSDAKQLIGSIFRSAINLSRFPQTGPLPAVAGRALPRNYAFRHMGSGRAVLPPTGPLNKFRSIYVMHNDVVRRDDRTAFAAKLRGKAVRRPPADQFSLRSLHFLNDRATAAPRALRIVTVKRRRLFFPADVFDPIYMKTIFDRTHRAARTGKLWGKDSAL